MTKFTNKKTYDLEERTINFAKDIIKLVKKVRITAVNKRIIEQLVGSAGSVGANYCEANEAESKKDFIHKISICKKEVKETKYWIKLLEQSNPELSEELKPFKQEAQELLLIFSKIIKSSRKK